MVKIEEKDKKMSSILGSFVIYFTWKKYEWKCKFHEECEKRFAQMIFAQSGKRKD